MKLYKREKENSTPISFKLLSNQDHQTPVPGRTLGYLINVQDGGFQAGVGDIRESGGGFYDLVLGDDGTQSVVPNTPPTSVGDPGFSDAYFRSGSRIILIPATGGNPGTDPVYFRVDNAYNREVVPISAGNPALFIFAMVSNVDHVTLVPGLSPVVTMSRDGILFETVLGSTFEIGYGFYNFSMLVSFSPRDLVRNQEVIYLLKATAPNTDTTYESYQVFEYNRPA